MLLLNKVPARGYEQSPNMIYQQYNHCVVLNISENFSQLYTSGFNKKTIKSKII